MSGCPGQGSSVGFLWGCGEGVGETQVPGDHRGLSQWCRGGQGAVKFGQALSPGPLWVAVTGMFSGVCLVPAGCMSQVQAQTGSGGSPIKAQGWDLLFEPSSSLTVGISSSPTKAGGSCPVPILTLAHGELARPSPPPSTRNPMALACPPGHSPHPTPRRLLGPISEIQDSVLGHLGTSAPMVIGHQLLVVIFHPPSFRTLRKQGMGHGWGLFLKVVVKYTYHKFTISATF